MKTIEALSDLPERPVLADGRYWPSVPLWQDVEWTLVPRSEQIFTTHRKWADTDSPEVEVSEERLDCAGRPQVLLVGCSYLAGDYLPKRRRLLARLREANPGVHFTSVATSGAGLVTNLAAHLASCAEPGEILVGTETARRLGASYRLEHLDHPEAMEMYRVWQPLP